MFDRLIARLIDTRSEPAFRKVVGLLVVSYVIALLIPVLIYAILAVLNGIFDIELVIMMIIGFPISIFTDLQHINIHFDRKEAFIIGYGIYLLVAASCIVFKNRARLLKIFLWTFWILLLVNLVSCVPKAVIFGLEQIH